MGFMAWSKEFELGIPEMDEQHKKWLDLLNSFYSRIDDIDFQEKMNELIDGVIAYTEFHFSEEEALMESINYKAIDEQKAMHSEIIAKIRKFKEKASEGKLIVSMSLTSELKKWFKEHILIEDKKYSKIYKN